MFNENADEINAEMFLDAECVYCKKPNCLDPICKYKEIRNYAKTGLAHEDNQEYLIDALEHIQLLTEFLICFDKPKETPKPRVCRMRGN